MTVVNIKNVKGTKRCVIRRRLKFENCEQLNLKLEANQLENKINDLEKIKLT